MFPKTLQGFFENRKKHAIRSIFTEKYRMFPKNRLKKVPVKHFCAKNRKKSSSAFEIAMHVSKNKVVWRIDDLSL